MKMRYAGYLAIAVCISAEGKITHRFAQMLAWLVIHDPVLGEALRPAARRLIRAITERDRTWARLLNKWADSIPDED